MPEPTIAKTDSQLPTASDHSNQNWDAVGDYLEAFAIAWELDPRSPPELRTFLPADPPDVRRLILVELVKLDLDCRLNRGRLRALDDYIAEFPELDAGGGPPFDLLYEDYHVRRKSGQNPDPAEYYRRFPDRADDLARLLGSTNASQSATLCTIRATTAVKPGDRLDDFDLLALLGAGRFAKVFLARQRSMQRIVALKVSASRGAEAETLAQLDHPHIVRIYDRRFLCDHGVQLVYMPYVAGGTLQNVVVRAQEVTQAERSGRTLLEAIDEVLGHRGEIAPAGSALRERWSTMSWPAVVCTLGVKLARALDYAHRRGVLHRDVKPANILLTAEGEPLLADFNVGVSSNLKGFGPGESFGGSLGYMSVEHLEAFDPNHSRSPQSLDGRADLFGLAVTLWELLTGTRPFGPETIRATWAETLTATAQQRRAGPSPEFIAYFPEPSLPGLKEILLRCLDPDPDRRPATAGELARELELCLHPATRELLRPEKRGWEGAVRRHPLLAIFPPALGVNVLAALFNISYNRAEIIANWPAAGTVFDRVIPIINMIMFPAATIVFALVAWPITRGLKGLQTDNSPTPAELSRLRRKSLHLGAVTAAICIGCWIVAGVIWPVTLRASVGPPPDGPMVYLHFLSSIAACGLIAATYPYFLATFVAVRVLYPALLGPYGPDRSDGAALHEVARELGRYRAATTVVPLLCVVLLGLRGAAHQFAVPALGVAGLAGVALAFFLEGRIRADLTALAEIPVRDA